MSTRWGYLGPEATFTEAAARALSPDDAVLVPCRDIGEVLRSVEDGEVVHGVVPIENRLEGGVAATLDALADAGDLLVEAEVEVPVEFVLGVVPGTALGDVAVVESHPVALASCRAWLAEQLPDAELRPVSSTARAAADVGAGGRQDVAAIANPLAAERYGLESLATDIADLDGNRTRFIQLGPSIPARTGWDKTSLVVYINTNRPGALLAMLEVFAERGLDLTKIESRPTRHELGDYRFFVDVAGHLSDERVADAVAAIRRTQRDVKLLGSYPRIGPAEQGIEAVEADDAAFRAAAGWVSGWQQRIDDR